MHFAEHKYKLNKNGNEMEQGKFHQQFYRDTPCASVHLKIAY